MPSSVYKAPSGKLPREQHVVALESNNMKYFRCHSFTHTNISTFANVIFCVHFIMLDLWSCFYRSLIITYLASG